MLSIKRGKSEKPPTRESARCLLVIVRRARVIAQINVSTHAFPVIDLLFYVFSLFIIWFSIYMLSKCDEYKLIYMKFKSILICQKIKYNNSALVINWIIF